MLDPFDYHGVPPPVAKEYLQKLNLHIQYVQEAGQRLLVPDDQLRLHDQSKFTKAQFFGYAMHFCGGGAPEHFAKAWLQHQNSEPHHWEFYIMRTDPTRGASGAENGILPMPHCYVREMVADFQGASKAYTGSWKIGKWLQGNMKNMRVHSQTAALLREVLSSIGYEKIVKANKFASEM